MKTASAREFPFKPERTAPSACSSTSISRGPIRSSATSTWPASAPKWAASWRGCTPVEADIVVPVPDSGNYAALGFAEELGIPYNHAFVRNHYIGRTFLQPSQLIRDFNVRVKLNLIKEAVHGKRVVVVDDSIVRGTTARARVVNLREAGAKEVHVRISCPPHKHACHYGIDFPDPGKAARQPVHPRPNPRIPRRGFASATSTWRAWCAPPARPRTQLLPRLLQRQVPGAGRSSPRQIHHGAAAESRRNCWPTAMSIPSFSP